MSDFYCEQVLSGKTSVRRVHETANVLAFHHTRPSYPTHIVVIPKTHVASLLAPLEDALLLEIMGVVRHVAAGVLAATGSCKVVTNLGTYQDSHHLHWHVISGPHSSPQP